MNEYEYTEDDINDAYNSGYDDGQKDGTETGYRTALIDCTDEIEERGFKNGYDTATTKLENEHYKILMNVEYIISTLEEQIQILMEENYKLRIKNASIT